MCDKQRSAMMTRKGLSTRPNPPQLQQANGSLQEGYGHAKLQVAVIPVENWDTWHATVLRLHPQKVIHIGTEILPLHRRWETKRVRRTRAVEQQQQSNGNGEPVTVTQQQRSNSVGPTAAIREQWGPNGSGPAEAPRQ